MAAIQRRMKLLISTCVVLSIFGQKENGDKEIKSPWCTTNSPVEIGHTATITCRFAFNIEHSNYDYSVERYTENSDSRPVLVLDCFYEPSEGKKRPCKPTDDDYTLTGISGFELTLSIAKTTSKHAGTYVCKTTAPSQKGLQHCYLNVSKPELSTSLNSACQSVETAKCCEAAIAIGCVLGIVVLANAVAIIWMLRKKMKDVRRQMKANSLDIQQERIPLVSQEDGIDPISRPSLVRWTLLGEAPDTVRTVTRTEPSTYNLRPRKGRTNQTDDLQDPTLRSVTSSTNR